MTRRIEKFLSQRVVLFLSHILIFIFKIFILLLCPAYEGVYAMVITGVLDAFFLFLEDCAYLISK